MADFPKAPPGYDKHVIYEDQNTQVSFLKKKQSGWISLTIIAFFVWLIGREFSCSMAIQKQDGTWENLIGEVPDSLIQKHSRSN